MTASNWETCVAAVLIEEGGYSDNPADPGGATNMGITIATLSSWRGSTANKADVKYLTQPEAEAIYKAWYWLNPHCDQLPSGADLAVFDFAVNSGSGRAVKSLQKVVGVTQDGSIGPLTIAACQKMGASSVISSLSNERLAFLRSLSTYVTFGAGWTRRVTSIRAQSLAMAAAPPNAPLPPTKPVPVPTAPTTSIWLRILAAILSFLGRKP